MKYKVQAQNINNDTHSIPSPPLTATHSIQSDRLSGPLLREKQSPQNNNQSLSNEVTLAAFFVCYIHIVFLHYRILLKQQTKHDLSILFMSLYDHRKSIAPKTTAKVFINRTIQTRSVACMKTFTNVNS